MLLFLIGWGMFKKLAGMAGWIIIILGFNLIVVEAGPYEGMAIPFYLLCIGVILTNAGKNAPAPLFIFLKRSTYLLTIGYIALFFVKLGLLVTDYEYRTPSKISHVIAQHIPPQSHVLSDLIYYYSLRENHAVLQCLFPFNGGNFESRAQFYKEKFDFDYFVFTSSQIDDDSFEDRTAPIMRAFEMEKIAEIHADDSPTMGVHAKPILGKILASLLHSHTPYTYHGYIYKRIRR
jgi:hypothetical protein